MSIISFTKQSVNKEDLKYSCGQVCYYEDSNTYFIGYEQNGAKDTFSISQPVFDEEKNLMGYLGIGIYNSLDYHLPEVKEKIPVYFWQICNPTIHCKKGKKVFSYWQNYNITKFKKEEE